MDLRFTDALKFKPFVDLLHVYLRLFTLERCTSSTARLNDDRYFRKSVVRMLCRNLPFEKEKSERNWEQFFCLRDFVGNFVFGIAVVIQKFAFRDRERYLEQSLITRECYKGTIYLSIISTGRVVVWPCRARTPYIRPHDIVRCT